MKKISIVLLLFMFWSTDAAVIYTAVSEDSVTVGDRIYYTVSLVVPPGASVTPPEVDSSIRPLIIKEMYTDRNKREKSDSLSYNYAVASYSVGRCSIPSMPYIVQGESKTDTLFSEKRMIDVFSVINTDSAQIRDVKSPVDAGRPPLWWVWIIGAAVIIAAAVFVIRRFIRRKKDVSEPPPKPPYEEALELLEQFRKKDYLSTGEIRLYAFDLSFILKRYISRRFGSNVMDYTSSDMNRWIKDSGYDKGLKHRLTWFFTVSDPVKFARVVPDRETLDRLYDEVWGFIRETKPAEEDNEKPDSDKGEKS